MKQQETVTEPRFAVTIIMVLLVVVVILAAFLRFYKLSQIPPAFNFDEASHALDALDILNGQLTLISSRLSQVPMGYMYLLAGTFKLFGTSPIVQRSLTAIFGLLLMPISFFVVLTLFKEDLGPKARWVGIFTALLTSTSFWAVNISRIGYEYILPPVFALMGVALFWPGYQHERWGMLLAAGILIAIEFYLYVGSASFLPVIPTSVLLHALWQRIFPKPAKPESSIRWKALIFFSLVIGIVALPLFLALVTGTDPEVKRTLQLSIFSRAESPADLLARLIKSIISHAESFLALSGDMHWRHNLAGRPILNPVLALSFVAGLLMSLKRIRRLPYLFLLIYWSLTLLPSIVTFGDSPLYSRMSSALPPTYIFIGIAWTELYWWLNNYLSSSSFGLQKLASVLALIPFLLVGLVWLPIDTYQDYFLIWANRPEVAEEHDTTIIEFMERMERETDPEAIFVVTRNVQPNHEVIPRPNYTIEFFYQGQAPILYIFMDKPDFRQTLTRELANYRTIHLVTKLKGGDEKRHRNSDSDKLLPFLFEKYGELVGVEKTDAYSIFTYRLDSNHVDFEAHLRPGVPPKLEPLSYVIGDQVKLAGIRHRLEGNNLLIDLAWQPLLKLHVDYTVFIQLLDENGERVTGVDVLPERGFSTLDDQEIMVASYTVPLSDEIRPGTYTLLIGLYFFTGDNRIDSVGSVILPEPVILE